MDLSRYADLFLTESREHLSAMNASLLELERAPDALEPVDAIFRAVHTVKGMSATMGYAAVTELAHELETLLDRVRSGHQLVTPAVVDLFFRAADALEMAIERTVQGREEEIDVGAMLSQLKGFTESARASEPIAPMGELIAAVSDVSMPVLEAIVPASASAAASPDEGCTVRVRLAAGTALPAARAMLVVKHAETLGRVLGVTPPIETLVTEGVDREFSLRLDTAASLERIQEVLLGVGDVEHVEVMDGGGVHPEIAVTPVSAAERAPQDAAPAEQGHRAPATPTSPNGSRSASRFVRVDSRRLDALMNMVGELVITRGRVAQLASTIGDPALEEAVEQASRLIAELQDEIMLSRMVPVAQVFDRFPRLVRDAARALGKQIEFTIEGQEIELDRSMLDEIGDPVMHLLRNAVDHGIEPPDVRTAHGKPPWGQLTLSVARERSSVTIRVTDDGKGIDRVKVLQRAQAEGLVEPARTELSDDELVRLIARPGFTTADRVTDLSGRGVGIDAVITRVRALGGAVEIRSTPGRGTTVTARMPVTLAIVRALLAGVDNETYAVPMAYVTETVELDPSAVRRIKGREVMMMRDDVLPLVRFRELVRLPVEDRPYAQVVVLESGDRRTGLVVDALTGQQDIVVKQFDAVRESVPLFSGATILSDGAPALIVDVGSVL